MITENRAHFREWAVRQYTKQTYPHRDFVLVCSPRDELFIEHARAQIPDAQIILAEPGTWIPVKRNMAKEAARGELITWIDDDDWSCARRLELVVAEWGRAHAEHPELKVLNVESTLGYFSFPLGIVYERLFSSWQYSLYNRELAQHVHFPVRRRQGSDAYWTADMRKAARGVAAYSVEAPTLAQRQHGWAEVRIPGIGFVTSHNANICNSGKRLERIQHELGRLRVSDYPALLPGEWDETLDLLYIIAERLGIVWTEPIVEED